MRLKDIRTEQIIQDAAKSVFLEYGLYGARMQVIADRAGINKALLHYYFRNKERLFDKVFGNALERYFDNMEVISDQSLSIPERVHVFADRFIDFLEEYPQMSIFLIKEISSNEPLFHEKVNIYKKDKMSIIRLVQMGKAEGSLTEVDPVFFFVNLMSLCAYPFLASPMIKVILSHDTVEDSEYSTEKLKASVHEFINLNLK
jgi:AcrR family transcriptional regulator